MGRPAIRGPGRTPARPDERPADRQTPQGGQEQDVDQRLSRDGHISRCHDLAQLCTGPRAVIGYGSLNGGDTSISLNRRNPFLC